MVSMSMFHSCLLFVVYCIHGMSSSRVYVTSDGGYRGIVITIKDDVSEDDCGVLVNNIKEMFLEGSLVLHKATQGRLYFGQVTIVVPTTWSSTACGVTLSSPTGNSPYKESQIIVSSHQGRMDSLPYTV